MPVRSGPKSGFVLGPIGHLFNLRIIRRGHAVKIYSLKKETNIDGRGPGE
jgi:hypothetical protein